MSKKETKKTETVEITVMDANALKKLPEEVKEDVMFFQERLGGTELTVFNPLVYELLQLEEKGKKIKMIPPDKDGNFDTNNIQEFIDLKKSIRSYRASVKRISTELKRPRNEENKKITSISNFFVEKATEVFDNAEKEFDQFVQAEAEKAAERERKKNEEFLKATEEAKREAEEQRKKNEALIAYNNQKSFVENLFGKISEDIPISNLENLQALKEKVLSMDYSSMIKTNEFEEIEEIKQSFEIQKGNNLSIISDKIKLIELENEAKIREARSSLPVAPSTSIPTPPAPPVPPTPVVPEFGFMVPGMGAYESIVKRVEDLEKGIETYLESLDPNTLKDGRVIKALDLITHIRKFI